MSTQSLRLDLSPGASLLLAHIGEPSNNDLRVVVIEAFPVGAPVETEVGLATPIRPSDWSRGYELTWWRYVAYSVRNESYFRPEPLEQLGQGLFGTRSDTAFRGYVSTSTLATDEYPGRLDHWFLYTEWHCIDVVSDTAPELRELTRDDVRTILRELEA